MALPTITVPHYFLKLPSNDKEIKYRPFLVKEEKILLIALESEDQRAMVEAVKEVIVNCTYGEIQPEKMAMFDVEYIFLHIRAKSKGEDLELKFQCPKCEEENSIKVDLMKVQVKKDKKHKQKIELEKDIGIMMKYPTIETSDDFLEESQENPSAEQIFKIMKTSIDYIYDAETTHKPSDYTEEEINTFIDSLPDSAFQNIQDFFTTMPKLKENKKYKCKKCEYEEQVTLEGLQNFLG